MKQNPNDKKLTIVGHLEELRSRLIKSLIAVAVATAICFIFAKQIFEILKSRATGIDFIYIEVTELLGVYMKVALFGGVALALPFLIYQLVMFIRPALPGKEKRYLYLLLPGVILFFVAGVAFAYFVLLPPALRFLINPPFASGIATPQIRIGNYVEVVVKLLFTIGLVFETPLLISFLARIGVITPRMLSKNRKWAVLGSFVLAAIITPTFDPVNQSLVAVPLIVLYELGIWLAKLVQPRKARVAPPAAPGPSQSNPDGSRFRP